MWGETFLAGLNPITFGTLAAPGLVGDFRHALDAYLAPTSSNGGVETKQFETRPDDKNPAYNSQAGPAAFITPQEYATQQAPAAARTPLYDEWDKLIASQIAKYGGYDQKTAMDMVAKKAE